MATAAFETPKLKTYPVIPLVQVGAMAHSKPYIAAAPIQQALGFPGELVEDRKPSGRTGDRNCAELNWPIQSLIVLTMTKRVGSL